MVNFTITQRERLIELSVNSELFELEFQDEKARDNEFRNIEKKYVKQAKEKIDNLLKNKKLPESIIIKQSLEKWLMEDGFTQVSTPTIISKDKLNKMTITDEHHLTEQVFWLDKKTCLRPMLAPNLYVMMRELKRVTNNPVKIFEVGSCFRKESQGAMHMNEFTMLNFVELATIEDGKQMEHLEKMARTAMKVLGIEDYKLVKEGSTVYGETLDIEVDGIEVASGSYGPHFLDGKWGVFDTWVGIGFGIERLALVKGSYKTIKRVGKSTSFIDGMPLNI